MYEFEPPNREAWIIETEDAGRAMMFNWIRKARAWFKGRWCRLFTIIEYCHDCGVRQPLVWWSDNDLWHEVTGEPYISGDNMAGVLCPKCFDVRCQKLGILLRWMPTVEHRTCRTYDREYLKVLKSLEVEA